MHRSIYLAVLAATILVDSSYAEDTLNLEAYERLDGFLDLYWDQDGQ